MYCEVWERKAAYPKTIVRRHSTLLCRDVRRFHENNFPPLSELATVHFNLTSLDAHTMSQVKKAAKTFETSIRSLKENTESVYIYITA